MFMSFRMHLKMIFVWETSVHGGGAVTTWSTFMTGLQNNMRARAGRGATTTTTGCTNRPWWPGGDQHPHHIPDTHFKLSGWPFLSSSSASQAKKMVLLLQIFKPLLLLIQFLMIWKMYKYLFGSCRCHHKLPMQWWSRNPISFANGIQVHLVLSMPNKVTVTVSLIIAQQAIHVLLEYIPIWIQFVHIVSRVPMWPIRVTFMHIIWIEMGDKSFFLIWDTLCWDTSIHTFSNPVPSNKQKKVGSRPHLHYMCVQRVLNCVLHIAPHVTGPKCNKV